MAAGSLTPAQKSDLAWLSGYRLRANGRPRPTTTPADDGWDDLDALLKLIEQALASKTGGYGPKP